MGTDACTKYTWLQELQPHTQITKMKFTTAYHKPVSRIGHCGSQKLPILLLYFIDRAQRLITCVCAWGGGGGVELETTTHADCPSAYSASTDKYTLLYTGLVFWL